MAKSLLRIPSAEASCVKPKLNATLREPLPVTFGTQMCLHEVQTITSLTRLSKRQVYLRRRNAVQLPQVRLSKDGVKISFCRSFMSWLSGKFIAILNSADHRKNSNIFSPQAVKLAVTLPHRLRTQSPINDHILSPRNHRWWYNYDMRPCASIIAALAVSRDLFVDWPPRPM